MFTANCRRARGAVSSSLLFTIIIVAAIAAAGWFLVIQPHMSAVQGDQAPAVAAKKQAAAKAAPAPANVSAMSTDQLLAEASKAVREERLLSPAGNNAFEYYLKVLERQPDNEVAKEALRETFPFGANEAEQEINNRNFAEAQREIGLLAKADPENYTLTILRSKLDAQRKTASQEQQQAQAALLAKQKTAQRQQQQAAEERRKQQQQASQEAAPKKAPEQSSNTTSVAKKAPAKQPEPAKPNVQIQDAVLVSSVQARYPTAAFRRHQQGWVQVQFTVNTDGNVINARVQDAKPKRVFDRAALRAVDRWKFRPALRNGQPFPVTMSRRIEFKLGSQ
jgi:protein TonB